MRQIKRQPELCAWLLLGLILAMVGVYGGLHQSVRERGAAITITHCRRHVDRQTRGLVFKLRKTTYWGERVIFDVQVHANKQQRLAASDLYVRDTRGEVNMFELVTVNGNAGKFVLRTGTNRITLSTEVANPGPARLIRVARRGQKYMVIQEQ